MKTITPPLPILDNLRLDALPLAQPTRRIFASTPRLLWLIVALIFLGALALFAVSTNALHQSRAGLQSVGNDCAPSIVAALKIRTALADLDANLINQFIVAPGSKDMTAAVETVTQRRGEFAENLVHAAENITFGDAERVPITTLARNIGTYEALIARAKGLHEKGDLAAALPVEREGEKLLHQVLIPAADELARVNSAILEKAFTTARRSNGFQIALVVFTGGVLTAGLVVAQFWLARCTRRIFNPALLLATLLTLGFTIWTAAALLKSSEHLRAATKDAFASVRYLWDARAISFDGNAAESRWLLDRSPAEADAAERLFKASAARLARLPEGITFTQLVAKYRAMSNPLQTVPGFTGFLAQELSNITFQGEREVATTTLEKWGVYYELDAEIRKLERSGDHAAAIALCLSYADDGSNGAFAAFHTALGKTLDINERAFATFLDQGFSSLGGLDGAAPFVALLVAALGYFGIAARLREYRA